MLRSICKKPQIIKTLSVKNSLNIRSLSKFHVWGSNKFGQTGLNVKTKIIEKPTLNTVFQDFDQFPEITKIVPGAHHCLALGKDEQVYSWGYGRFGQLGHGNTDNYFGPQKVSYFENEKLKIVDVAAGFHSSAAITSEGDLYVWGYGGRFLEAFPFIGVGNNFKTNVSLTVPRKVSFGFGNRVSEVFLGEHHAFAKTKYGTLYFWGNGRKFAARGITGSTIGDIKTDFPVAIVPLGCQDDLAGIPYDEASTRGGRDIKKYLCGKDFSLALLQDGSVLGYARRKDVVMGKPRSSRLLGLTGIFGLGLGRKNISDQQTKEKEKKNKESDTTEKKRKRIKPRRGYHILNQGGPKSTLVDVDCRFLSNGAMLLEGGKLLRYWDLRKSSTQVKCPIKMKKVQVNTEVFCLSQGGRLFKLNKSNDELKEIEFGKVVSDIIVGKDFQIAFLDERAPLIKEENILPEDVEIPEEEEEEEFQF